VRAKRAPERVFVELPFKGKMYFISSPDCRENPFLRRRSRRKKDCNGKRDQVIKEVQTFLLLIKKVAPGSDFS